MQRLNGPLVDEQVSGVNLHTHCEELFALLRRPYVTLAEVVLELTRELVRVVSGGAGVLNGADFVLYEPRDDRFPFVLGYEAAKFDRMLEEAQASSSESAFSPEKVNALLQRRQGSSNGRAEGGSLLPRLRNALDSECARSIQTWLDSTAEDREKPDNQNLLYSAVFELIFSDDAVGTFGVPNLVHASDADGLRPFLVHLLFSEAPLSGDAFFLPLVRLAPHSSAPMWSEKLPQLSENYVKSWHNDVVYEWIRVIEGLKSGAAVDKLNLYVPVRKFGRLRGYLLIRFGEELDNALVTASKVVAQLGQGSPLFERFASKLDAAWCEGLSSLALEYLSYLTDDESASASHRHDRVPPSVGQTVKLWVELLTTRLEWQCTNKRVPGDFKAWRVQDFADGPHVAQLDLAGLLETLHLPTAVALSTDELGELGGGYLQICLAAANGEQSDVEPFLKARVMFASNLLQDLLRERERLEAQYVVRQQSRRSAVISIMARNMSHNIGSHVLARLSTAHELRGVRDLETAASRLNAYLRTRMDFIADVATATPTARISCALRRDVVEQFDGRAGANVLLDHISGISELRAANIHITVKPSEDDPRVALSNGVLGAHALYAILENLIRNCAKHGHIDGASIEQLLLTLTASRSSYPGLLELVICDDVRNGSKELYEAMNQRIGLPVLTQDGQIDDQAWGMKEMKICAAYLRGVRHEDIDRQVYNPPLSETPSTRSTNSPPLLEAVPCKGNLGYRIYLPLPQVALILDLDGSLTPPGESSECAKKLENEGISYGTGSGITDRGTSHDFLVVTGQNNQDHVGPSRDHDLPLRRLSTTRGSRPSVCEDRLDRVLRCEDLDEFPNELWQEWVGHRYPRRKLGLQFDLDPNQRDPAFDSWNEVSREAPQMVQVHHTPKNWDADTVIYDRHARLARAGGVSLNDGSLTGAFFYDAYRGTHTISYLLEHPPTDLNVRKRLAFALLEAGACGIIMLDERIQELALGDADARKESYGRKEIPFKDILRYNRIFIPDRPPSDAKPSDHTSSVNLDAPQQWQGNLEEWLKQFKPKGNEFEEVDFLVVHLGVLEKMLVKEKDIGAKIDEWEEAGVTVIVTSGRGSPPLVERMGCRFVHYSEIGRHILEARNKFNLCKALFSARRIRK